MARSKKVKESLEPKNVKEIVKEYKDSDLLKCKINIAFTDNILINYMKLVKNMNLLTKE